jgi:hypothetical protein
MRALLSLTLLMALLAGCVGQTPNAVSFGLEPGALIAEDASFEEPRTLPKAVTSRTPSGSQPRDGGPPTAEGAGQRRELCPVKCKMVVPGRASLAPEEETEFVAQVQATMERLVACDASVRPSPTLTLRFAEDGSLIAAGVDEDMSRSTTTQCLRDSADLKALKALSSLPGAVVRCQEQCAGLGKPARRTKGRSD